MSLKEYVIKDGKRLRCGYTTGSCAVGATKAALIMLKNQEKIDYVKIMTPAGIELNLEVVDPVVENDYASCAIRKDSGDDPDVTDGILIYSKVSKRDDGKVILDGGEGVGRITRKGLFGEIGEAAINPVPKKLLLEVLEEFNETGINCEIVVPEGVEISKKTFNQYIGIEGGISIIGTKGIVYPMSEEALIKTIYMEVDMIVEKEGLDTIILTPGNYGQKIVDQLDIKGPSVQVSNFIGDALKYVYEKGFKKIILIGHIGKFAKLSIGIFNTHSSVADTRMEAFIYYLALMKASMETILTIDNCLTAEIALNECIKRGHGDIVQKMEEGAVERVKKYLKDKDLDIEVYIYSMEQGVMYC